MTNMTLGFRLEQATLGAARLREVQSSCAHLTDSKRRDYLRSELARIIAGVPEGQRPGLL